MSRGRLFLRSGLSHAAGGETASMRMSASLGQLENARALDRVVEPLREAVQRILRPRLLRNALHGVWVGHPVHPALVQLPIGAFLSAAILDALPGGERPARLLIATGAVAAGPAAVTGIADWAQLHEQQQRVGIVHAMTNTTGLSLYVGSLLARGTGRTGTGKLLSYAGLGALTVGAFLGGHLSFRRAGGANHAEAVPHLVPPGWHDLCAIDDLARDGTPHVRMLSSVPLLVVRHGDRIDVLSDRCSHLAGPLHEGEVTDEGTGIRCPWHGSTFRLHDGAVVQGPATAPQHAFDVRVSAGRVLVSLPGAG